MKIAIPLSENVLSAHFALCEQFGVYTIEDNQVTGSKLLIPPPHQPGVLTTSGGESCSNLLDFLAYEKSWVALRQSNV